MSQPFTFLCISTFFKGNEFLRACKAAGNTVFLLTDKKIEHKPWAREAIDEIFYVEPDEQGHLNLDETATGLAFVMRTRPIDRIVALDDFDVEKAAFLREQFRIPGMGQTTARYFRDKLAMRMRAMYAGLRQPRFSPLFSDAQINAFADSVEFPCLVKPRGEASTTGIRKVQSKDELWAVLDSLGDQRHRFLVEQFRPGAVYHVDALSVDGQQVFCQASQYLNTPMEVAHGGGIFRSVTEPYDSDDEQALRAFNQELLNAFNMSYSASHSEFIKCHEDGEFYFLETASRVGGANLAEMVEAASGINLWREWANIESTMARGETYQLPAVQPQYSGIIISLTRQQWPDGDGFSDPEIWWKMHEEYHVGLIVQTTERARILELLDDYARRIYADFHASAPVGAKTTH
ncbi:MAG: ATPase [Cytophagaceae bacterium]|nr:ATPase [Cytophagaceae bacterium]